MTSFKRLIAGRPEANVFNSFSLLPTDGSSKCMFTASLSRLVLCWREKLYSIPVNPNGMVKISTVDLLIKVACCLKKWTIFCNIKSSWSKLVGTRRSTVLSLPLQQGFPADTNEAPLLEILASQILDYDGKGLPGTNTLAYLTIL